MAWHPLKAQPDTGEMGVIYLVCYHGRFGHAGHYSGWTSNLAQRLADHARGSGSNLCRHAARAGITWELVTVIPGDKNRERAIKNRGGAAKWCPRCRAANGLAPLPWAPLVTECQVSQLTPGPLMGAMSA